MKKIKAFNNINEVSIKEIIKVAKKSTLSKGEKLFSEKDKVDKFYAVISGKMTMSRNSARGHKRVFFIIGEGELINEVVFDDLPVSVMCDVFEEASILEIDKAQLLSIMERDFKLTLNIMNSMGRKQRRLYRQLKNTLPIKNDKKLAAKLWKLSKDHGIKKDDWVIIDLDVSITYLSYMLGTSRETISRSFKLLCDLGIVKSENKKILVKEEELLKYYREV